MIRSPSLLAPGAVPDVQKELKGWKDKFDSNALTQMDLVQFFQTASPHFVSVEPRDDPMELGKNVGVIDSRLRTWR